MGAHVICRQGQIIGKLIVFPNHDSEHELGLVLHPDHWGKGYSTLAGVLGLKYLRESTPARYVVAYARSSNLASNRVIEKLGFTKTGKTTDPNGVTRFRYELPLAAPKRQGS